MFTSRRERLYWVLAGSVGVAPVYALLFARVAVPAERSHLIEYSMLAGLIYLALLERRSKGLTIQYPAVVGAGASAAIRLPVELVEALIPLRVFDPIDIVFNLIASCMAVVAIAVLRRVTPGVGVGEMADREPTTEKAEGSVEYGT